MFRKMRRFKQQITDEECRKILAEEGRGVLSLFGEDGYPYGIPMNYFYDEGENKIYFHCAKEGHKIDALKVNGKVSFCVLDKGTYSEDDWACTLHSIIVFGEIHLVSDEKQAFEKLCSLGIKYYPPREEGIETAKTNASRTQILELDIHHITGKRVHEK